jgi:hypothetical protein
LVCSKTERILVGVNGVLDLPDSPGNLCHSRRLRIICTRSSGFNVRLGYRRVSSVPRGRGDSDVGQGSGLRIAGGRGKSAVPSGARPYRTSNSADGK